MIVGLGSDLIEVERIERSLARFGDRFLTRIFTSEEIAYCEAKRSSAESFAVRFAAKEAGAKALGTGIARGVAWKDIEVRRAPGHAPTLHFHGAAAKLAAKIGVVHVSVSLTHSRTMAMAVVVAER